MPQAFDTIVVPTVPGSRIATTEVVADSAGFTTTETVILTVVAPVVTGRTYRVYARLKWGSSVAGDSVISRMREDGVSGAIEDHGLWEIPSPSGFGWGPQILEREFTASATENKTFVVTGARASGTGNVHLEAGTAGAAYLYVDYIRG